MQGSNRKAHVAAQQTHRAEIPDPRELDFERDDRPGGRAGDRRRRQDIADEMPPERVRQAGLSGREDIDGGVTADDLSPETLLDDDRSHSPSAHEHRESMDTLLSEVEEADIGEGQGLDEAELADLSPIAADELAERRKQAGATAYRVEDPDEEVERETVPHSR